MESSPPCTRSESRTRSATRLSKLRQNGGSPIPHLSLDIIPSSPKICTISPAASTVSPKPPYSVPLREILMLSSSPLKRSKVQDKLEVGDDSGFEVCGIRKRCKSKNNPSPKSNRRLRRRLEQDLREWREVVAADEFSVKPRKKRHGDKAKKEKSSTSAIVVSSPGCNGGFDLDEIGAVLYDLITWKDVSKSSLWFGFGVLCFLSTCFTRGVNFSIFSFLSQIGILFLGLSFMSNWIRSRDDAGEIKHEVKLTEEHILRIGRLIIPAANLAISKTRHVFSGEPVMTLKVAPILFIGAKYGHLLTAFRLCALCFFISFTAPKLYSSCSSQVYNKVELVRSWALDSWGACSHKKVIVGSTLTAFWNLTSMRTRLFAAFLCLVIVRYRKQQDAYKQHHENVAKE